MPVRTEVYRERLVALGQPGGPIHAHFFRTAAQVDARAKYYLEGVMVGKRTGNLLTSQAPPTVIVTGTTITGVVSNIAAYAYFVHEGTRPHEILPVRARALRFTPSTLNSAAGTGGGRTASGGPVFRKRVMHPGTEARPFLRRALEDVIALNR
jgi:hypothetical protein